MAFHRFLPLTQALAAMLLVTAMIVGPPTYGYAQEGAQESDVQAADRQDWDRGMALRFPQPKITERQWAMFQAEVMAKPGAEIIESPEAPDLTVVALPNEFAMVYFTRRGPAHPAVIVARVVSQDGRVMVRHNGYFAGSEQAFSRWLLAVAERADSLKRLLDNQPEQRRP